jgi:putative FmdB family regulatory protein
MAMYEFECADCGERFVVQRPISQHDLLRDQPPICPRCGKTDTHQLVSVFSCRTPSG